jgi:hypothetical protein
MRERAKAVILKLEEPVGMAKGRFTSMGFIACFSDYSQCPADTILDEWLALASAALQPLTSGPLSADLTTCHNVRDQCSACHADQLSMGHAVRRGLVDYVSGGGEH